MGGFRHDAPLPKRIFGGRSSDAVQTHARVRAGHGITARIASPGNFTERSLSAPSRCEVVQLFDAAFRQIYTLRTSPETNFGERPSDAVQAYARVRAEHGKGHALPSPEFSLNARIPTLPNCVQEGDFNLASTALQNCTTSSTGEVRKLLRGRTD